MRSLQRLRHTRPPAPREVTRIRRAEDFSLDRRKRNIWKTRLRRLGVTLGVTLAAGSVIAFLTRGVVLDGLVVHSSMVTPRAPAAVRVAELLVQPGASCERGDVLMRLEALETSSRRALEEEVAEHETRLALVVAGGELDGSDVGRRFDFVEQAELEARLSRADHDVALARLRALEEDRDSLVASQEEQRMERAGETDSIRENLVRATAGEETALAESRRADFDAERATTLEEDGIVSHRDSLAAEVDREKALGDVDEASALVRARTRELEVSKGLGELEERSAEEALDAMQARIDVANREAGTAAVRANLWKDLAEERRTMLPGEEVDGAELRELELELMAAQLRRAQARLEELDHRIGNRVVRAECDGVVDQVFVTEGSVVDADAPLLRYYDPSDMRLVVYADPDDSESLTSGADCRIFSAQKGAALEARVATVGLSWVSLPPLLQKSRDDGMGLPRLPARIECKSDEDVRRLQPNMRLRVVLRRSFWPWS